MFCLDLQVLCWLERCLIPQVLHKWNICQGQKSWSIYAPPFINSQHLTGLCLLSDIQILFSPHHFSPFSSEKTWGGKRCVIQWFGWLVHSILVFSPVAFHPSLCVLSSHTRPLLRCLCVFSCQLHVNHYFVAHKFESKMFQFQPDRRTLRYKKQLECINLGESSVWLKKNLEREHTFLFNISRLSSLWAAQLFPVWISVTCAS